MTFYQLHPIAVWTSYSTLYSNKFFCLGHVFFAIKVLCLLPIHLLFFFTLAIVGKMDVCKMVWTHQLHPSLLPQLTQWVSVSISSGDSYIILQIWQVSGSIVLVLATDIFCVLDFLSGLLCIIGMDVSGSFCDQSESRLLPSAFLFGLLYPSKVYVKRFPFYYVGMRSTFTSHLVRFSIFFLLLTKDLPHDLYVSHFSHPFRSFVVSI